MCLRTQNGPANMALIRQAALNIFRNTASKFQLKT